MNSISSLTPEQLWKAADLKEKIDELEAELAALFGDTAAGSPEAVAPRNGRRRGGKRRLSAQGLANIRAGVAKRMRGQGGRPAAMARRKPRRRLSAAGRKALSEKLRARWAARKAAGKAKL